MAPPVKILLEQFSGHMKENEETENCLLRERQNGREIKEDIGQHIQLE